MREVFSDPTKPSYPESPAANILYRLFIVVVALLLIVLGKSKLPFDSVGCVEDSILDKFKPVTDVCNDSPILGIILTTLSNFIVDLAFISIIILWYLRIDSFRPIVAMACLAISKILISLVIQTNAIPHSFRHRNVIPSILGDDDFKLDYMFNAQVGLLVIVGLELSTLGLTVLANCAYFQAVIVALISLALRHNYFMDIFNGSLIAYVIYRLVSRHQEKIDLFLKFSIKAPENK